MQTQAVRLMHVNYFVRIKCPHKDAHEIYRRSVKLILSWEPHYYSALLLSAPGLSQGVLQLPNFLIQFDFESMLPIHVISAPSQISIACLDLVRPWAWTRTSNTLNPCTARTFSSDCTISLTPSRLQSYIKGESSRASSNTPAESTLDYSPNPRPLSTS